MREGRKRRKRGEKRGEKVEGNETQLVSKILQLHQEGKTSSPKLRKWFQNQGSGVGSISKAIHTHNSRSGTELMSGFLGLTKQPKRIGNLQIQWK